MQDMNMLGTLSPVKSFRANLVTSVTNITFTGSAMVNWSIGIISYFSYNGPQSHRDNQHLPHIDLCVTHEIN